MERKRNRKRCGIAALCTAVALIGVWCGRRQNAAVWQGSAAHGSVAQNGDVHGNVAQDGVAQGGTLQGSVLQRPAAAGEAKRIALTFDDGPSADYTPMLLDGLKERGVKATFFVLGKCVQENPEILLRMKEDGHLIGNHTYDHVNLRNLSEKAACEQLRRTNELIESVTGYHPEFVRPPFGEWHPSIDQDMTMMKVMWNVDPLDWATGNADAVVERVVRHCKENDIILLHDATASSVRAALRIVDILQEQGYEFVTVDEILLD